MKKIIICLLVIFLSGNSWADLTIVYESQQKIGMLSQELAGIRLISEVINITAHQTSYDVSVTQHFINDLESEKKLKTGFPSWSDKKGTEKILKNPLLKHDDETVKLTEYPAIDNNLGFYRWYTAPLIFKPKINTTTFNYSSAFDDTGNYKIIEYLYGTGYAWDSSIEEIKFIVNIDADFVIDHITINKSQKCNYEQIVNNKYEIVLKNIEPLPTDKIQIYFKNKNF